MPEADTPTESTETAPVADTTPAAEPDTETLGDGGAKALAAERAARKAADAKAKAAEKQLNELAAKVKAFEDRDKSEAEKQQEAITSAKQLADQAAADRDRALADLLRHKVGIREGLPASLIARLQGDTEEEITADAKQLMKDLGDQSKPRKPAPDPALGQAKGGGTSTADQFASAVSAFLK